MITDSISSRILYSALLEAWIRPFREWLLMKIELSRLYCLGLVNITKLRWWRNRLSCVILNRFFDIREARLVLFIIWFVAWSDGWFIGCYWCCCSRRDDALNSHRRRAVYGCAEHPTFQDALQPDSLEDERCEEWIVDDCFWGDGCLPKW